MAPSPSAASATSANWKLTGSGASTTTPPGGVNVALFKPGSAGAYTVSGDGAVDQVNVTAPTTLTDKVIAQGRAASDW